MCSSRDCNAFVQVTATAKHVGQHIAIFVDNTAPTAAQGGYAQADLDNVGSLFDTYLYPIDTTAFGGESDKDNNGVVIVLLTPKVNALSSNCSTDGVILGYFFGLDLEGGTNSNNGEIFYGIVPDPSGGDCAISTTYANNNLPPTFIHEFQHMISYNQHALVRHSSQEDVWLNEGLSHFAEELGEHRIPDSQCLDGSAGSCLNEFAVPNFVNAYNYLDSLEQNYLVAPGNSGGTLAERGAAWLFLRWLIDQYGSDTLGTNITRALVQTKLLGAANVEHAVGQPFESLVPVWQLANYTEDLTISGGSAALQYPSWPLRAIFSYFHDHYTDFPRVYPLVPDTITTTATGKAGMLLAGSGPHALIIQPPGGGAIDVRLTASDGTSLPPATVKPRIAIVRLR